MFGIGTAYRNTLRAIRLAIVKGPAILCYHRVADLELDPQLLAVSPRNFEEHLSVIKSSFTPMTLTELLEAVERGTVPSNAVALTFDDGYADNLTHARPLLHKYDVPATVFVATGYVEHQQEYWWDELERVFLCEGDLPPNIQIPVPGAGLRTISLDSSAAFTVQDALNYRRWSIAESSTPTSRHEAYRQCHRLLRDMEPNHLRSTLDAIRVQCRIDQTPRQTHRPMTWKELSELMSGGLMSLGGHTRWHPNLAVLPFEIQMAEIEAGKSDLSSKIGVDSTVFAYPYGLYSKLSRAATRDAGIRWACSLDHGPVTRRCPPYRVPRTLVRNWSGAEFESSLALLFRKRAVET